MRLGMGHLCSSPALDSKLLYNVELVIIMEY